MKRARRAWRGAPVLLALTVLAAACSSAPPVGAVGATLAAMNGTVTLDKVIAPALVVHGSVGAPFAHKLVAVVLTVHSAPGAAADFHEIYSNSKLIDSKKLVHVGKSTAKYTVTDCATYPPFGLVRPASAVSGCVVFVLAEASTPVELKISGKAAADWTIAASAIAPGTAPAPAALGKIPTKPLPTLGSTVPGAQALGATSTTIAGGGAAGATTSTAAPGTASGAGTTSTPGAKTSPSTAVKPSSGASPHRTHHHGAGASLRIMRVIPRAAAVGSRVAIFGKKLTDASQVTFNGTPAVVKKNTSGRIVVVVPSGATSGPIVVTTSTGSVSSPRTFVVL
jgi:hypothetical protein